MRAAFRVIARSGLAAATVREVAREAGRSPGALVHYMASKDQLILEVSDYSAAMVRKKMIAVEEKYSGLEALRRLAWETMPLDETRMGHWRIWLSFWVLAGENDVVKRVVEERYAESHERFHRVMKRAQTQGEISADIDITAATESFCALIDGLGLQAMFRAQPMTGARQRKNLDDWINSVLLSPAKQKKPRK